MVPALVDKREDLTVRLQSICLSLHISCIWKWKNEAQLPAVFPLMERRNVYIENKRGAVLYDMQSPSWIGHWKHLYRDLFCDQ